MTQHKIFLLRFSCKDRIGIVSKISTLLAKNNCNIIESKQFTDQHTNTFFIRQSFYLPNEKKLKSINDELRKLSVFFEAHFEIFNLKKSINALIMVSKLDHCLVELLNKIKNKNLNLKISAVISNHNDLNDITSLEKIPFFYFPIFKSKLEQEEKIINFIDDNKIDVIILARYMQILSPKFVNKYYGKIINIHHSFLPSFKGAKPYHQAYKRGVKIIGATAHFVNRDLDEGPIIEQDIEKVDHELDINDLVAIGRDIEARVLYKAVKNFSEGRIFLNGMKTVVFKGDKLL